MDSGAHDTVLTSGDVQLRFSWRGDRYHHALFLGAGGAETALLESVEGTPLDRWPPSPPLQSLHQEQRPGGVQVALLVGMAGSSHWSAAIELCAGGGVTFDVACRVRSEPESLGNLYRLGPGVKWDENSAALTAGAARCRVACHANDGAATKVTTPSAGLLGFQPTWSQLTFPATVRWRYTFTLE